MATFRLPSSLPTSNTSTPTPTPSIPAPPLSWLIGSWNVTHSTLPMWKKSRNVRIKYTPVAGTLPRQLDDMVTYQSLSSTALKSVHGVDKPFDVDDNDNNNDNNDNNNTTTDEERASLGYNWRGKGWLVIASSKWEILGYGEEEGTGNSWVSTYFAKTLFTPAGVDLYSRKGTLKPETVESIKAGLAGLGGSVADLADQIFEVTIDGDRQD